MHEIKSDLRRLRTFGLSLVLFSAPVLAAVITPVPGDFVLDGSIGEWNGIPPTKQIRYSGDTSESDSLWLGRSPRGLVIAGLIRNNRWKFAKSTSELASEGRLEVWLSAVEAFNLPEIKYGEHVCAAAQKPEEKSACMRWIEVQTEYRAKLQKQATRMWRIAPQAAEEAYALPAYDGLTESQRNALRFPRPAGLPLREFRTGSDGAVTFEILIPWELFPPADRLSLERLRLAFDLKSSYEGSPPDGESARAALPLFAVTPPIATRITTCGQPLLGKNMEGEDESAFYFLNSSLEIDEVFFFENPGEPYDTPLPKDRDISPIASYQTFSAQELDKGEFLCEPFMSYRKGEIVRNFPFRLEPALSGHTYRSCGKNPDSPPPGKRVLTSDQ